MTQQKNAVSPALEPAPGMLAPIAPGELAVVAGAGKSGLAACRLLAALGARLRLVDSNPANITRQVSDLARTLGMSILAGPHNEVQFMGASLVVVSPGVPLGKLAPHLKAAGSPPVMAEMELALRYVCEPILAVTGTSGKTTTVSLAAAMLEAAGKKVFLGGNIGVPLSEYVLAPDKADVLVLEMSSFQLQGSEHLKAAVAVLLNLTENHLDHHKDMAEYREAKFRIFAGQGPDDLALLPGELLEEYKKHSFKARVEVIAPNGLKDDGEGGSQDNQDKPDGGAFATPLPGAHNRFNIQAAWQAARALGADRETAGRAVAAFGALEHRLEPVGELNGILFVNDSKSTTVQSLAAALQSFERRVILLAGGRFKGGDLSSLLPILKERARAVELFGDSREIFEKAWQGALPLSWSPTLPEAVAAAFARARPGDVLLLSPATSSYDLYANYMERGEHFRALVAALAAGSGTGPDGEKA